MTQVAEADIVPERDGLYAGISEITYHADTTSLSSTGVRKMEVPALFRYELDRPSPPTPAMDFGTVVHTLVLGTGSELLEVDAKSRNSNAYREADSRRGEGLIPLLASEAERARGAAKALKAHPVVAKHLAEDGAAELSGYHHDPETGVRLRYRPDWLTEHVCVDVKTSQSANPSEFARSVAKWGYHQQWAFYEDGLAAHGITGLRLLFAVVEKEPPYLTSVCELDPESIAEGRRLNRIAIDTYAQCVETNRWPGYSEQVHPIGLPTWLLRERDKAIYDEAAELERNWDAIFN